MTNELDLVAAIERTLRDADIDFQREVVIGDARPDFVVTTPSGEKQVLNGFLGVTRNRLRTLGGDALTTLAKTDELELLYLHLYSMRNFNDVKDRFIGSLAAAAGTADEGDRADVVPVATH